MLNKEWGTKTRLAPAEATEEAKPQLLARPTFLYVTDGSDVGAFDKLEKVVLANEKVRIGMWAFDCAKMTPDEVKADKVLSAVWKEVDRGLLFVSRDMKTIDVIGEKTSATKVFEAMRKHAGEAYKTKFDKNVEAVLEVLTQLDKINNRRGRLDKAEAAASKEGDIAALEEAKKERGELAAEEKKLIKKRDELLVFELKEAKGA